MNPTVFVFGDSLTKYLEDDCSDIGGCHVRLYCERGGTVSSIRQNILDIEEELIGSSPDIIFLHVGTNDLNHLLVQKIVTQYNDLLRTVSSIFPNTPVLVNNVFTRRDSNCLNDAGQYFNIRLGNLAATLPNVTYVDIGKDFDSRDLAPDDLHLKRDAYYDFAAELIDVCISHVSKSLTARSRLYHPSMIPPLFKPKSAKQLKRERRQYLARSAEMCRFTRPFLFRTSTCTRFQAPRQAHQPAALSQVQPKPLHCFAMIPYRQLNTKTVEKTCVKISTKTKKYIQHRQAMKVKNKKKHAAKKRRRRKKGAKVRKTSSAVKEKMIL